MLTFIKVTAWFAGAPEGEQEHEIWLNTEFIESVSDSTKGPGARIRTNTDSDDIHAMEDVETVIDALRRSGAAFVECAPAAVE